MLKERFHIGHTTLQVDHAHDQLLLIGRGRTTDRPAGYQHGYGGDE
jgi:hypothetical protein